MTEEFYINVFIPVAFVVFVLAILSMIFTPQELFEKFLTAFSLFGLILFCGLIAAVALPGMLAIEFLHKWTRGRMFQCEPTSTGCLYECGAKDEHQRERR